jgi:hypothetical protein
MKVRALRRISMSSATAESENAHHIAGSYSNTCLATHLFVTMMARGRNGAT